MTIQGRVNRNIRRRGGVVLSRRQWGSKHQALYLRRLVTHPVSKRKADTLWQHITVTFDSGNLVGDFKKDMQTIERIGYDRFRTGFSYNYAVDMRTGMIGVGMPLYARGSHTLNEKGVTTPTGQRISYNQNYVARAVAWLGMPGDVPTDRAKMAMARLFAALMDEGALTQHPDYLPHSWVARKDCPTQAGRAAMPWIRSKAHSIKRKRT